MDSFYTFYLHTIHLLYSAILQHRKWKMFIWIDAIDLSHYQSLYLNMRNSLQYSHTFNRYKAFEKEGIVDRFEYL